MKPVKIVVNDDWGFVDVGEGYLMCIGTRDAVERADAETLSLMLRDAIAQNAFKNLNWKKVAVN